MARILLISTAEQGHLNPLVGVAQRLAASGATVGWACLPEASPQLRRLGVPIEVVRVALPSAPDLITGGEALATLARDKERLFEWVRTLLIDLAEPSIEPLLAALKRFAPDAIALDPMLYGAVIAAHRSSVPYLAVSSSLNPVTPETLDADHLRNMKRLRPEIEALFQRHEVPLRLRVCDALSPHGTFVFSTRAYVGDVKIPHDVELCGPSHPIEVRGDEPEYFPWARMNPNRPLVYASFGSQIAWQPLAFDRLARATGALGAQLVVSAGDLANTPFRTAYPDHVLVFDYAPQRALLKQARVMVTHGGANSVMEALSEGVPL
ncbi:MAG: glycosyltransferase [Planctomycetota bacterium]|jgi:MGT family glycosyltransferase